MHTSFRRDRSGFLAGRRREGPKRTDGRTRNQAFHVALPKGRQLHRHHSPHSLRHPRARPPQLHHRRSSHSLRHPRAAPPAAPSPSLTPPPSSSSGLTRGSAGRPRAQQKWCSLAHHRSPSPARRAQQIPGSSPRMTRVKVEALRKILSPPPDTRAILPARCRQGRGCIRASGETDPGSLRVAAGKAQSGRMAGRGTRRSTSHSRKGEGHRREVGRESGDRFPGSPTDPLKMPISRTTNPSPRRRHKPKTPDAWGDDRFIY